MAFRIVDVGDLSAGQEATARVFEVDFDALAARAGGFGVLAGYALTKTASTMQLNIAAGQIVADGQVQAGSATSYTPTADPTHPKIGIIYVATATGAIGTTTGTAAAEPVPPTLSAGQVELYRVLIEPGITDWDAIDITTFDKRLFAPTRPDVNVLYVDGDNGDNAADGLGWDRAVADVAQAHTLASAGDVIRVRGLVVDTGVAITKDNITVVGEGWGATILRNSSGNYFEVDASGFTVRNCEFDGNSVASTRAIEFDPTADEGNYLVEGCWFHDHESQPILLNGATQDLHNVVVRNTRFTDSGGYVLDVDGLVNGFAFVGNVLEDCADTTGVSWMRLAVATATDGIQGGIIANNVLYSSSGHRTADHFIEAAAASTIDSLVIANNVAHCVSTGQFSAGWFDMPLDGVMATNNVQLDGSNGVQPRGKNADKRYAKATSTAITLGLQHGVVRVTASVTITLPDAADFEGVMYMVQRDTSAGNVTVSRSGTDQIDYDGTLQNTVVLGADHSAVGVYSDGTSWHVSATKGTVT